MQALQRQVLKENDQPTSQYSPNEFARTVQELSLCKKRTSLQSRTECLAEEKCSVAPEYECDTILNAERAQEDGGQFLSLQKVLRHEIDMAED